MSKEFRRTCTGVHLSNGALISEHAVSDLDTLLKEEVQDQLFFS